MNGYLLYHASVHRTKLKNNMIIYHAPTSGNQDPYLWNRQFLHTYSHMENLRKMAAPIIGPGDITFWIRGEQGAHLHDFTALLCDLVFVVQEKKSWANANKIEEQDEIVDSAVAYVDHYSNWRTAHVYGLSDLEHGERFTLKADPKLSFQPLDWKQERFDILPFLRQQGVDIEAMKHTFQGSHRSQPLRLEDPAIAQLLYDHICSEVRLHNGFKRTGEELQQQRMLFPYKLGG